MDGAAICGAKPLARKAGRSGRCVAVVESVASSPRQQGRTFGPRPRGVAARLAAACSIAADGSGSRGVASFGHARRTVWRNVVATTNGEATGSAINIASARPPLAVARNKVKTPDPFTFAFTFDPGRRPFMDGAAICGAKPLARKAGRSGRCVAVVESVASSPRQQGRTFGPRPRGVAARLAAACSIAADGSGSRGVASFGHAAHRLAKRRGNNERRSDWVCNQHCVREPPLAVARNKVKTPDPFTFSTAAPSSCRLSQSVQQ